MSVNDDLFHYRLYIDGAAVDALSGETMPVLEPAHGRVMGTVAKGGPQDVDRAVRAARQAFDLGPWPHTPPQDRARILHAIADGMEERSAELAEAESRNLGVPLRKAMFIDVPYAIEHFRTFAELARRSPYEPLPWTDIPSVSWNFVWREPIGVCGQIIPWNFPLLMAAWKLAPALAAGCTVVLKPASYTPLTALLLTEIIHDTGMLPRGVLNVVTGPGAAVGEALAAHPQVDKLAFTGSTEVGRSVMRLAADTVKKVTLELGGKSPSILLPDADLDIAVDGVLFGVYLNAGQACEAGTRCLVPDTLYDTFMDRLVARASTMKLGDPLDLETDVGPLVSAKQRDSVMEYIALGQREGATLALGGDAPQVPGFADAPFVSPTIFTDVRNDMRIAQEEIFGPVLSVIRYSEIGDAIRLANDTIYGLGAAVWSRNLQLAIDIAKRIRSGSVWINDHHLILPTAPFGGYKQSGIGREHGVYGLNEYTQPKHIHVDLIQRRAGRIWWDTVLPPTDE